MVNLSFDLIGFGANTSHVTVSDVRLSGLPQLHDDAATIAEDNTLAYNPFAQVDNAAILQLGSHLVDQPAHGAVTVNADGTFVYTPEANYFGADRRTSDTLLAKPAVCGRRCDAATPAPEGSAPPCRGRTYRLNDGPLESNLATVSLTVTPVNDAPVAADVALGTSEDTPLAVALGAYGSDVDSSALTTQIVTGPAHGAQCI